MRSPRATVRVECELEREVRDYGVSGESRDIRLEHYRVTALVDVRLDQPREYWTVSWAYTAGFDKADLRSLEEGARDRAAEEALADMAAGEIVRGPF